MNRKSRHCISEVDMAALWEFADSPRAGLGRTDRPFVKPRYKGQLRANRSSFALCRYRPENGLESRKGQRLNAEDERLYLLTGYNSASVSNNAYSTTIIVAFPPLFGATVIKVLLVLVGSPQVKLSLIS